MALSGSYGPTKHHCSVQTLEKRADPLGHLAQHVERSDGIAGHLERVIEAVELEHLDRIDRKREVHERTKAIASDLGIELDEPADVALRFVLSEPAVSTVIPGMRSLRNVERNVAVSDGRPVPPGWRKKLHAHRWVRNFYD